MCLGDSTKLNSLNGRKADGLANISISLWWVPPGWENQTQNNTPISQRFSSEETVTVIDPRHPLCGRTLPLKGITNKAYLGRCCVVWIQKDVERYVPVSATDREFDPNQIHPTPLCLASVEALLQVFEALKPDNAGGNSDAISPNPGKPINQAEGPDSSIRRLDSSE